MILHMPCLIHAAVCASMSKFMRVVNDTGHSDINCVITILYITCFPLVLLRDAHGGHDYPVVISYNKQHTAADGQVVQVGIG